MLTIADKKAEIKNYFKDHLIGNSEEKEALFFSLQNRLIVFLKQLEKKRRGRQGRPEWERKERLVLFDLIKFAEKAKTVKELDKIINKVGSDIASPDPRVISLLNKAKQSGIK